MTITPAMTNSMNAANSLFFNTVFNRTREGIDITVTDIINEIMVPTSTPLLRRASAIGIVPNMSA